MSNEIISRIRRSFLVILILAMSHVVACRGRQKNQTYGSDDACVQNALKGYSDQQLRKTLGRANPSFESALQALATPSAKTRSATTLSLPPFIDLFNLEGFLRLFIDCYFPPFPIKNDQALPYAQSDLPPWCNKVPVAYPTLINDTPGIAKFFDGVGRLEVRSDTTNPSVIWGSGFMVAPGVFATTCHVLESLRGSGTLLPGESIVVDFGDSRRSADAGAEFPATFIDCSDQMGLDIALLSIPLQNGNGSTRPDALPLLLGRFEDINFALSALVAYADLDHFINADKYDFYKVFAKKDTYGKFALFDTVSAHDKCDEDKGFEIVLDTETSTVGESGGVVIDLTVGSKPAVVGVHTCCSAYFSDDKSWPPRPVYNCARLRRTFHNQDISSWSILKDSKLCPILQQYGTTVVDAQGNPQPLKCPRVN